MSCESFILLHEMQTKLMALDKLKKESPAKQLARKAKALLDNEATIVQCPDCCGDKGRWLYCDWCGGQGCRHCQKEICATCKGEGEVLMHKDGTIEVLV